MKFKEKDRQLTILIEDEYDWMETFDTSNTSNIIEIPIGDNNIDFFLPNWNNYDKNENIALHIPLGARAS